MTEYELQVVKNMKIMGESGEDLLKANPNLKDRTQRQAIRAMAKMLMQSKADAEFKRHFDEGCEASNETREK